MQATRMAEDASGQKLLKPLDSVSEVGYGGARQRGGKGSKAVGENGQLINGSTTLSSRSHAPVPAVPNGPLVVSAGWGRTGTSSLKVALDQLGFSPCFHARFMPYFSDFFDAMYEASEGRAPFPAREMFRRFNAAVDIPAPLIPLVLEAYPDAKVILTVRDDPEKWYTSYVNSLLWLYRTWWFKPFSWVLPMGWKLHAIGKWWLLYEFNSETMSDKQACIDAYLAHNERIKATVPPERLLIWQAKDGWAPLCKFLEMDVPAEPFPRKNEGANDMAMQIVRSILKNPLAAAGFTKYDHRGPLDFDLV